MGATGGLGATAGNAGCAADFALCSTKHRTMLRDEERFRPKDCAAAAAAVPLSDAAVIPCAVPAACVPCFATTTAAAAMTGDAAAAMAGTVLNQLQTTVSCCMLQNLCTLIYTLLCL